MRHFEPFVESSHIGKVHRRGLSFDKRSTLAVPKQRGQRGIELSTESTEFKRLDVIGYTSVADDTKVQSRQVAERCKRQFGIERGSP